jgi:riboflavin synthase
MFTGLIESIGFVVSISKQKNTRICVESSLDVKIGDSVAINGTCLTVVDIKNKLLCFDVSPETMLRTNLSYLKPKDPVNLERAMIAGVSRLDGHIVLGHVDFVSTVKSIKNLGEHRELDIYIPSSYKLTVVSKGSIAIDGISLTINYVFEDFIRLNIIPHTWDHTNLYTKRIGDYVNVETDIIGKYVARYMEKYDKSSLDKFIDNLL